MANEIKSSSFYWGKLIKETWIRPKEYADENYAKFRQAIDETFDAAPPTGTRHAYYSLKDETVALDTSKALLLALHRGTASSVQRVRAVLRDTGKTPLDLHRKLASAYLPSQPQIVDLLHGNYRKGEMKPG